MLQTSFSPLSYATTRLAAVRSECDAISLDLLATASSVQWESEAAGHFQAQVWNRISEISAVGELAAQVMYSVMAQTEEGSS
ncbi:MULTISPECIES: hypothetical protein [unclassified Microbacterium]|uniref:hypothetical protein n=1 Tax=unclassified Microbacterium TaxID=2609290 RepID=UPI00097F16FE|nr:hypothetical protein [Microbacterium sp. JB110]RCS60687.1 hypothetical protein CIK77_08365 [Microbacterium sp. JB110]SJM44850.1 hypothetical protein CZ774_01520 [Frigoribacterium sp. JB110]